MGLTRVGLVGVVEQHRSVSSTTLLISDISPNVYKRWPLFVEEQEWFAHFLFFIGYAA